LVCFREILARVKLLPQELREAAIESIEQALGHRLSQAEHVPEIYQPLRWDDVAEMLASGLISVGNHTHRHVILAKCTPENMREELEVCSQIIQEKTGLRCRAFCYPNGQAGDYNQQTERLVAQLGYSCALVLTHGLNDRRSNLFALRRPCIRDYADLPLFTFALCGVTRWFCQLKRALGGFRDK
jgi:peptidoglycan/xylan/chitin deacetylase (PgdA/CDA1 family)